MFRNVDESVLRNSPRSIENAYINDAGGISRFPGYTLWKQLPTAGPVYLHEWRGDMIAAANPGRVYRIDRNATATDVTGVVPTGGKRVIFARTTDQLVMAAGGPIVQLGKSKTELLSAD